MLVCLYSRYCYAGKNQPVHRKTDGARGRVTCRSKVLKRAKLKEIENKMASEMRRGTPLTEGKGESMRANVLIDSFTHLVVGR